MFYTVDRNDLKKKSIDLISEVKEVLDNNNIDYWLDQGSVLGAVRDNDFIPWDDDIDFSSWRDQIFDNPKLIKDFQDKGFKTFYYPRCQALKLEKISNDIGYRSVDIHGHIIEGDMTKSFFQYYDNDLINKFLTYIVRFFDLAYERKIGPSLKYKNVYKYLEKNTHEKVEFELERNSTYSERFGLLSYLLWLLPAKNLERIRHYLYQIRHFLCAKIVSLKAPKKFYENLETYNLHGVELNVPSPVVDYIVYKYGENWKTPIKEWVYYRDDGAASSE